MVKNIELSFDLEIYCNLQINEMLCNTNMDGE